MHTIKIGQKDVKFVRIGDEVVYPNYIKDGLVLWYDFSGRANTDAQRGMAEDLSGNGNDGELMNFEYDAGSGYIDNGLEFDGVDDYVQGVEEMCFDSTNFSMSFVLDMREESGPLYRGLGSFGNVYAGVAYGSSFASIRIFYRGEGGGAAPSVVFHNLPEPVGIVNYTIVFDNDNLEIELFMNSVSFGKRDMISRMLGEKDISRTALGRWWGHSNLYFSKQSIYSFRKYNRLLTQEEIAHNYKIDKHRFNIEEI